MKFKGTLQPAIKPTHRIAKFHEAVLADYAEARGKYLQIVQDAHIQWGE